MGGGGGGGAGGGGGGQIFTSAHYFLGPTWGVCGVDQKKGYNEY